MTHPGIELCGYTVKQAVTDGQKHAEAIQKLNEIYPAAACTVIMDLTVEAEAFWSQSGVRGERGTECDRKIGFRPNFDRSS